MNKPEPKVQGSFGLSSGSGCQPTEEELLRSLDVVIDGYSGVDGALIPILQSAQNLFGYLPAKVLKHISSRLNIPYSEVTGVVSFYSFFSTVPRGKHIIRVCLGTACYVRGGKEVLEAFKKNLKINVGETTPDRTFSLEVGRCFGACGLAPVAMIDNDVHQRVKAAKIRDLISQYQHEGEDVKEAR
ncbi:MAG: NAD(P)H-dependent oxidoreductase subunit E [Candidatus Omnitrophica bacterium]|nr:NAD(P)H-dependent oxidoreductase subunit E [Candidatus Omnitrophota bacterium]